MEENAKTEQFLEMDEEQLQAVTGAGLGQPNEKTSPITFNNWMADKLFAKAELAHQRGLTSIAETITDNAIKHVERAEQWKAEVVKGKRPISESSTKPSTSTNVNGGLKIR